MNLCKISLKTFQGFFLFALMGLFIASNAFGSVEYKVDSDWGSSFQGKMTIKNTTSSPYQNLTIEFDYPYEITSLWDAQKVSHEGTHYVLKLPDWKSTLNPNETYSFGFIATPGNATSKPSNIKLNGSQVEPGGNNSPKAVDDVVSTDINTSVKIDVLKNDTDPDNDRLFITSVSTPSHGTASISGDSINYFPANGFVGSDSFTYTIEDGKGGKSSATVTVNVKGSTPESSDVQFKVVSDWGTGFNANIVITNNSDAPFTSWTLEFDFPHEISSLWNGTIVSHIGDHYVVKDANWNANVPVKGSVTIGLGAKSNGTIFEPYNIKLNGQSVGPSSEKPVANNDTATVEQDKYVDIDVLKNDQGNSLTISKVGAPAHGTAVISNSLIVYTPDKDYYGADSFIYTVKDNLGEVATATVNVTVNKAQEPVAPVANEDRVVTTIDKSVTIDALSNDTSTNGGLTIVSVTTPSHGTASIQDNKILYTPESGYEGEDSFQYTIKDSLGLTAVGSIGVLVGRTPAIDKVNATYWSIWGGNTSYNIEGKQINSSAIDMDKIDLSYNCIIVAFIVTDANGDLYLAYNFSNPAQQSGEFTPAQVKQSIANAKAQGRKVIVSVGGEKFNLNMQTEEQKAKFVNQIENIIDEYNFDGLDLDLESGAIGSNPDLLANAVKDIVTHYRSQGKDFYLTAAPEWCYIVPFTYGSGQWATHSLAGSFYVKLINAIGIDNFTYIWPQTYNQGPSNGVTGLGSVKVTPNDGMAKFIAALVWAATTDEGYQANGSIGIKIPSSKFAIGIPATEGAAGGGMAYIATPDMIKEACNLVNSQGTSFAGFMNWSVDWDALKITDGQLSVGYSHEPWATGKAVAEALGITGGTTPAQDTTSPELSFTNLTDGETLSFAELSPIEIILKATDAEGTIADLNITVDGHVFEGDTATWIPSSFGTHKILATAIDNSGNITVLSINVIIAQSSAPAPSKNKQIIGYFTQWDAWKGDSYQLPAKGIYNQLNVDCSKYTMLNYSFFGVAKDGSLHSADYRNKNINADQESAPILCKDIYSSWDMWLLYGDTKQYYSIDSYLTSLGYKTDNWSTWYNTKTGESGSFPISESVENGAPGLFTLCKEHNVTLMATIGGWSMSKHFSEMASDPAKKALFLRDCKVLIDMGFDGIDIDWEFPGPYSGMNFTGKEADFHNFTELMRDIRATIGPDKIISAAFSGDPAKLANFEWSLLDQYMNYFNIMSYDLEGGWSDNAGHHSPLYGTSNQFSWDRVFKYLTGQKGVTPEKINMGVGFYGRGVETTGAADLGAPTHKSMKNFSVDGSILSAADFYNWGLFEGTPYYSYIKNNTSDWVYHWDDVAKVPYLTKGNYFLSYDDPRSIQNKADYVMQNDGGGVIVFQVFGDMQFSGGISYCNDSIKKLPKAEKVNTELLDVLYNTLSK